MSGATQAISIAVVVQDDGVLIGLRDDDQSLAGYWEFPGGKVEPGESHEQAVVREVLEETGLRVQVVGEFSPREFTYDHGRLSLRFFRCQLCCESVGVAPAGRFRWVQRKSLADYRFPPANHDLLTQLLDD